MVAISRRLFIGLLFGSALVTPLVAQDETARDYLEAGGGEFVEWEVRPEMPEDKFTFLRLRFDDVRKWTTDYPVSDLSLSFRLHELTSMEVDPNGVTLDVIDPELNQYPFAFVTNPSQLRISEDEAESLNKYLLNGGFLLVDDFWGRRMWNDFYDEMKRVFPNREPEELTFDHPIFNGIFELEKMPQVPSHDAWKDDFTGQPILGPTYEPVRGESEEYLKVPRFMAYYDDRGRMMMLVCVNNDLADGWEEESYAPWFFHAYSEKYCYPMAINILFHVMTH